MKALDKEGLDYLANKVYDAINSGGSADYIVEENTETQTGITWYYRKWASGVAECWGRFISTVTWSKWGNAYQGTPSPSYVTYPTGLFSTNPILSAVCYSTDGNSGTMGVEFFAAASTSRTPNIYAMRPDSGTVPSSFEAAFDISARGLWKEFTPGVSGSTYSPIDLQSLKELVETISGNVKNLTVVKTQDLADIDAGANINDVPRIMFFYTGGTSQFYISFDYYWIRLQFRSNSAYMDARVIYGNTTGSWTRI